MNMKTIKTYMLILCIVISGILLSTTSAKAASDPSLAPVDWAFEESSVGLNDAVALAYHSVDVNEDGFISIGEANAMTGQLTLNGKGIAGTLNGIEHFTLITEIGLIANELSGRIPNSLGNLSNLKILNLSSNQLSGEIPSELGNLSNLEYLSLSDNQLTGEIPSGLDNLSSLIRLDLDYNQLSGEIPNELGNLSNLNSLYLSNNAQLSGEIPSELGNLNNLKHLTLSFNRLSGEIPSELGNLSNLEILYLYNNELTGEIPSELGNLTNLERLLLDRNQLSGEIPSELGNLSNLEVLWLNDNQLTGEIPTELENLNNLNIVQLENNQLTSIKQSTFDFLTTTPTLLSINNQTYTKELTEIGITGMDYEFDGLPAYEQFPNYGMTFTYTLHLPDESSTVINPTISDGKVTILGSDLPQVGDYILVAEGSGGALAPVTFTTNFSVEDDAPAMYTVAFDPDNGTPFNEWESVEVAEGDLVPNTATIPQKEGYTFIGWATAFDVENNPVLWDFEMDVMPSHNITLWAAYVEDAPAMYTVTFDPDNGTPFNEWERVEVAEGDLVPNTATIPQKEGYTFIGWATAFDVENNPVLWNFETNVMPSHNITLWAAYEEVIDPISPIDPIDPVDPTPGDGNNNSGNNNNENNNSDGNVNKDKDNSKQTNLPKTGDSSIFAMMILLTSLLLTGGYLLTSRKEQ